MKKEAALMSVSFLKGSPFVFFIAKNRRPATQINIKVLLWLKNVKNVTSSCYLMLPFGAANAQNPL